MNITKDHIVDINLVSLPRYAAYLLEERLEDFVKVLFRISVGLDIPLLRYFAGMEEEEIQKLSIEGNILLLTALKDNSFGEYIEESKNSWRRDQLPVITKTDVIADDIGLINYTRKKAFHQFLPDYTTDATETIQIIDELDRCILSYESVLYKTYLSIQQEKLQESNDELKKRERELLEAQDLGKIGSFDWDLTGNGNSTYTPELFKIFEFKNASSLESFLHDVHPDDRARLKGALEKALHEGAFECEYKYSKNNKDKVLCSRGLVIFEEGRPVRMVGTVTDITEKANLISQLKENEELSKQAQALTNTGNWKWTIESQAIEWSDEMFRIYGLEPQSEKISFQRFITFIHEDDRSRRQLEISEAIQTGVASDYIMRIRAQNGEEKVLKGKGRVIKDKAGKSIGMLGTCQDITGEYKLTRELEKKNEELLRKNRDIESFNFIASHDLQEPLRKIQTFSNRVLHEGLGIVPDHLMHYFSRIAKSSNRMQKMLEDFLVFYHSVNSLDDIEVVDLHEVVSDAVNTLCETGALIDINITIDKLAWVPGRRLSLTQLFKHLLNNAIKFRKPDTSLQIVISSSSHTKDDGKKYVTVSMKDNGIGFDPKYAERIFQLFQKLHSQDDYAGSGIGLALCKKIIEDHKGWITVESTPEVGTTFNLFLPANY